MIDMYNCSGILYKFIFVYVYLLLLLIICILLKKPWLHKFEIKRYKFEIFGLIIALCFGGEVLFHYFHPNIQTYTGDFIEIGGTDRISPMTDRYVFWNYDGKKREFYLDLFSKKKIIPAGFVEGKEYTVYYDDLTKIIVKVEIIE